MLRKGLPSSTRTLWVAVSQGEEKGEIPSLCALILREESLLGMCFE
jgi:hypothetical protein